MADGESRDSVMPSVAWWMGWGGTEGGREGWVLSHVFLMVA